MDFTISIYSSFLKALKKQGFSFLTFSDFILKPKDKAIVLRHDVDALPENSLKFAKTQAELGIKGSYYFRVVPGSFDEKTIKEIYEFGHEIGYHYEDVSLAAIRQKAEGGRRKDKINMNSDRQDCKTARPQDNGHLEKELVDIAIERFAKNLQKLREIVPVKTICMHGSPMSRWDSRLLWKYFDYHDFGIVGEPYFDVNFDKVMYLTDTGRRWDGDSFNIRDKATGDRRKTSRKDDRERGREGERESLNPFENWKVKPFNYRSEVNDFNRPLSSSRHLPLFQSFHTTFDIIKAAETGQLPDKIMITFHPQRWTDKPVPWIKELVWQNVKNVGKYFLIRWISE